MDLDLHHRYGSVGHNTSHLRRGWRLGSGRATGAGGRSCSYSAPGWICLAAGLLALGWRAVHLGTGKLRPPSTARIGLGSGSLGSPHRRMGVGRGPLAAIADVCNQKRNHMPMNKPVALIIAISLLTLVPTIIGTLRGGEAKADRPLPRMLSVSQPHAADLILTPAHDAPK